MASHDGKKTHPLTDGFHSTTSSASSMLNINIQGLRDAKARIDAIDPKPIHVIVMTEEHWRVMSANIPVVTEHDTHQLSLMMTGIPVALAATPLERDRLAVTRWSKGERVAAYDGEQFRVLEPMRSHPTNPTGDR
jgi:hypothetical protein